MGYNLEDNMAELKFFSSGSTLLDLALGGGWANRVFNIVGDKSSGKTLLAIEAFANFKLAFPNGRMKYEEAEAAFDEAFAKQLGFPDEVERSEDLINTVEQFKTNVFKFAEKGGPSLYILDSLDALSDAAEVENFEAEMEGKDPKGSYGVGKAKEMSKMFRQLIKHLSEYDCTLGIISQVRENVGVTFGDKVSRSGGKALDFYASQVLMVADMGKVTKTYNGVIYSIGVNIRSKVKKNKVGLPFREADYPIIFGYGIDDQVSMLEYMKPPKGGYSEEEHKTYKKQLEKARELLDYESLAELTTTLKKDVTAKWKDIEDTLAPKMQKYDTICKTTDLTAHAVNTGITDVMIVKKGEKIGI